MTEHETERVEGLVVGRKRDGRSCYDPEAKRRLIEAAMVPGVSVARMALQHGINANLLRTWIRRHQQRGQVGMAVMAPRPAFIPVVPAKGPARGAPCAMVACLPNGIRLEFDLAGQTDLAAILQQLCALPCSGSTPA